MGLLLTVGGLGLGRRLSFPFWFCAKALRSTRPGGDVFFPTYRPAPIVYDVFVSVFFGLWCLGASQSFLPGGTVLCNPINFFMGDLYPPAPHRRRLPSSGTDGMTSDFAHLGFLDMPCTLQDSTSGSDSFISPVPLDLVTLSHFLFPDHWGHFEGCYSGLVLHPPARWTWVIAHSLSWFPFSLWASYHRQSEEKQSFRFFTFISFTSVSQVKMPLFSPLSDSLFVTYVEL